jgi:N-acetylglucosaminyldiphosphoundecaprenol N-acetyl-beta-D-mannosaminyltransferase
MIGPAMKPLKIDRITIGNISVDLLTIDLLHQLIAETISENHKNIFLHANAHLIELANTKEGWLIDFFHGQNRYVICDGSGVQFAARLTRQKVPLKIPYNTWIWKFAVFASSHSFSIFFLGGDEQTVSRAVDKLKVFDSGLNIVGQHHGYFNKHIGCAENVAVVEQINAAQPQILFVGFGMPAQELWVKENASQLSVNAIFTVGGAFDFFAGNKTVAPLIFRKLFLEWLYRLLLEPRRLLRRYTVGNMKFLYIVAKDLLQRRKIRFKI